MATLLKCLNLFLPIKMMPDIIKIVIYDLTGLQQLIRPRGICTVDRVFTDAKINLENQGYTVLMLNGKRNQLTTVKFNDPRRVTKL